MLVLIGRRAEFVGKNARNTESTQGLEEGGLGHIGEEG